MVDSFKSESELQLSKALGRAKQRKEPKATASETSCTQERHYQQPQTGTQLASLVDFQCPVKAFEVDEKLCPKSVQAFSLSVQAE